MEAVRVMYDLIDGTKTQEALISFQTSRKLGSHELHNRKVTTCWWRGFLKHHGNEIVIKMGNKFALNRHDWTTFENIQQMYDVIYNELVDVRVAFALSEPIFTDMHANVVDESCQFGLAQSITIFSPHYILFADKAGFPPPKRKMAMLVDRSLWLKEEQFHRQWHQQLTKNLRCFRSHLHRERLYAAQ